MCGIADCPYYELCDLITTLSCVSTLSPILFLFATCLLYSHVAAVSNGYNIEFVAKIRHDIKFSALMVVVRDAMCFLSSYNRIIIKRTTKRFCKLNEASL